MARHPVVSPFIIAVKRLCQGIAPLLVAAAVVVPSPARAVESAFATAEVAATSYFPQLEHNVADIVGTLTDGTSYAADFLQNFEQTGGVERWGYPTSAIFEETPGTLTQYYQRGVIDWRPPPSGGAHTFLRRLAWDYLGGGLGGSEDQGVEPGLTNPNPGEEFGPWGHKVANVSVEGVEIGFADFFHRLGGVASFGFPKTDARRDDHPRAVLHDPTRSVDSRIRQYFQAAVLEYHPESSHAPVKLRLLGDTLRDSRYPFRAWQQFVGFGPEAPFAVGDRIEMSLESRRGPRGPFVEDLAEFLELSLLRVDTGAGCGSGFFVTASGYAVTTWNLVANDRTISVLSPRGYEAAAQLVAGDAERNVALLKVAADGHIPVEWGDSASLVADDELVALGYDAALVDGGGRISCEPSPTATTVAMSNADPSQGFGFLPAISLGNSGGPVATRFGRVVGIAAAVAPERRQAEALIPAAEVEPLVAAWIEEHSRGGTPTLPPPALSPPAPPPPQPRPGRFVLAENERLACPGPPDVPGSAAVRGSKIEVTATVEMDPFTIPVGLLRFRGAHDSEWKVSDQIFFGRHGVRDKIVNFSWRRYSGDDVLVATQAINEDIASGMIFHIRFVYDSGSVGFFINGKAAHLEAGLPYGDNIWLSLECFGWQGTGDIFYHGLRITGIPLP